MRLLPVLLTAACALQACAIAPQPVQVNEELPPAQREIDFLLRSLEAMHPDPFGRVGEDEFRALGAAAAERYDPADPAAWHLELRQLVALVADSHTRVEGVGPFGFTASPFLLKHFPDGWWIIGAFRGFQNLVGCRVVSMDGKPIEDVLEQLRPYVSYENEAAFREFAPGFLRRPALLHAAGILASPDSVLLELEDLNGGSRTQQVPSRRDRYRYNTRLIDPEDEEPWRLRNPDLVYWQAFPADDVLYIRYSACRSDPQRPITDFAAEVERALRAMHPRTAVVDLRGNGGGDSSILAPVIRLFEHGGPGSGLQLVTLTDSGTFSSGLLNAWQLRERAGAELAGEPSAQKPNCFGEMVSFTLPVSRTEISCSTRVFRIVPGDPEQMAVDVEIPLAADDWFRGRDPVLTHFLAK
jgi:hypothetical protein